MSPLGFYDQARDNICSLKNTGKKESTSLFKEHRLKNEFWDGYMMSPMKAPNYLLSLYICV